MKTITRTLACAAAVGTLFLASAGGQAAAAEPGAADTVFACIIAPCPQNPNYGFMFWLNGPCASGPNSTAAARRALAEIYQFCARL